jgi:hypothetical protein
VIDTDFSGKVEHESDYGNATHSVWIVVDLATGEYGRRRGHSLTIASFNLDQTVLRGVVLAKSGAGKIHSSAPHHR